MGTLEILFIIIVMITVAFVCDMKVVHPFFEDILHLWPVLVPMPLEQPHSVFGIFNACTDIEACSSLRMVLYKHYKRLGEFALEVDYGRKSLAASGT